MPPPTHPTPLLRGSKGKLIIGFLYETPTVCQAPTMGRQLCHSPLKPTAGRMGIFIFLKLECILPPVMSDQGCPSSQVASVSRSSDHGAACEAFHDAF